MRWNNAHHQADKKITFHDIKILKNEFILMRGAGLRNLGCYVFGKHQFCFLWQWASSWLQIDVYKSNMSKKDKSFLYMKKLHVFLDMSF